MRIAATNSRYLLGLIFLVFGLNGFLRFLPQPPPESPLAQQYFAVMIASHYLVLPFLIQIAAGLLFLMGRYVPLALVLIAPVIVNILLFHSLMDPKNLPLALVVTLLWFLVFAHYRSAFNGIFQSRPAVAS